MFWAGIPGLHSRVYTSSLMTVDSACYSRDAHAHATNLLKVKASVIRTFVMERKCPDYGGSTVYNYTYIHTCALIRMCIHVCTLYVHTVWVYVCFCYSHVCMCYINWSGYVDPVVYPHSPILHHVHLRAY